MAGGNPSNEPAPWETPGKRHTQMYGAGNPPQAPAQPMPPQRQTASVPARPGPQAPQQGYPQAAAYPAPPQGAYPPPPQGAYPPAQAAYPAAPQPAYPPPQPGYPQQAAPYGQQAAYYPQAKPTSVMAIISLVCAGLGLFTGFSVLPGAIFGVLALRETGPTGSKSGRGLAIAGTVVNSVFLALGLLLVAIIFAGAASMSSQMEDMANVATDGSIITQRAQMYYIDKGDLAGGGHRFIGGYKNADKTKGPLMVTDLVMQSELKMPIERYFLEVKGDAATVWYTGPDGQKQMAGSWSAVHQGQPMGSEDWLWD